MVALAEAAAPPSGESVIRPEEHMGLIGVAVERALARWPWLERALGGGDELHSVAALALVKAARAYDPARGFEVSTYCVATIKRELLRAGLNANLIHLPQYLTGPARAAALERTRTRSLSGRTADDEDWQPAAPEPVRDEWADRRAELHSALCRLPARQRRLLRRVLDGARFGTIAAEWNVSRSRIGQLVRNAVRRLAEELGQPDPGALGPLAPRRRSRPTAGAAAG